MTAEACGSVLLDVVQFSVIGESVAGAMVGCFLFSAGAAALAWARSRFIADEAAA